MRGPRSTNTPSHFFLICGRLRNVREYGKINKSVSPFPLFSSTGHISEGTTAVRTLRFVLSGLGIVRVVVCEKFMFHQYTNSVHAGYRKQWNSNNKCNNTQAYFWVYDRADGGNRCDSTSSEATQCPWKSIATIKKVVETRISTKQVYLYKVYVLLSFLCAILFVRYHVRMVVIQRPHIFCGSFSTASIIQKRFWHVVKTRKENTVSLVLGILLGDFWSLHWSRVQ